MAVVEEHAVLSLWEQLPLDVFLVLLGNLPLKDILSLQQVCKAWGDAIQQHVDVSRLVSLEGREKVAVRGPRQACVSPVTCLKHTSAAQHWAASRQRSSRGPSSAVLSRRASCVKGPRAQSVSSRQSLPRSVAMARLVFQRMQSLEQAATAAFLGSLDADVAADRQRAVAHVCSGSAPYLPRSFGLGVCIHCERCHPESRMALPLTCHTCARLDGVASSPVV